MIYLDNSATTKLSSQAFETMKKAFDELWGNPSSAHALGITSSRILSEARKNVADAIGVRARDGRIVFCGSGTEANNLALSGIARAKKNTPRRIITDDSQHPSVMETLSALAAEGFEIVRISTKDGVFDTDALAAAVDEKTLAVTVMSVNNETGAHYDVAAAFAAAKSKNPNVITHTDAIQAFGKIPVIPEKLHADLISVSGHKIHAPKGIGALYIAEKLITAKRIVPVIYGGGQEWGLRSGTENVAAAAAFGEAAKTPFDTENAAALSDRLLSGLPEGVRANRPRSAVPYIISLTLPGILSETAVRFLSEREIYISAGSACSSNSARRKNPVLEAYGLPVRETECTVRVSLGGGETKADIDAFLSALRDCVTFLIRR